MAGEQAIVVQSWSEFQGAPDGEFGFDDAYFIDEGRGPRAVDTVSDQGLSADRPRIVSDLAVLLAGHKLQPTDQVFRHPDGGLIVRRPQFWDKPVAVSGDHVYRGQLLGHNLLLALAHFSRLGHNDEAWGETAPRQSWNATVLPFNCRSADDLFLLGEVVERMIEVKKDSALARDPLEVQLISRVSLEDLVTFRAEVYELEKGAAGGFLQRTWLRVEHNPVTAALIGAYGTLFIAGAFKQGLRGALLHILSFNPENPVLLPWARRAALRAGQAIAGATSSAVRGAAAELSAGGGRYLLRGAARAVGNIALIDFAVGGVIAGHGAVTGLAEDPDYRLGLLANRQILSDGTGWVTALLFENVMSAIAGAASLVSDDFEQAHLDALDFKVNEYIEGCDAFGDLVSANLLNFVSKRLGDDGQIDWKRVQSDLRNLYATNREEVDATYELLKLTGHRAHRGQRIRNMIAQDGSIRDWDALKAFLAEKIEGTIGESNRDLERRMIATGLAHRERGRFVDKKLTTLFPAQARFVQGKGKEMLGEIAGLELLRQILAGPEEKPAGVIVSVTPQPDVRQTLQPIAKRAPTVATPTISTAEPTVVRTEPRPRLSALLKNSLVAARRYRLTDVPGYLLKLREDQIEAFARNSVTSWETFLRVNGFGTIANQLKAAQARPTATDSFLLSLAAMADSKRDVERVIATMAKGKRLNASAAAGLGTGIPLGGGVAIPALAPSSIPVFVH